DDCRHCRRRLRATCVGGVSLQAPARRAPGARQAAGNEWRRVLGGWRRSAQVIGLSTTSGTLTLHHGRLHYWITWRPRRTRTVEVRRQSTIPLDEANGLQP